MKKFHKTYVNKSLGYWKDENKIEFIEMQPVHPNFQTWLYLMSLKDFKNRIRTEYPAYTLLTDV